MFPEIDHWYVMATDTFLGKLYAVIQQPTGQVLGYFHTGWQARYLARELNAAGAKPLLPTDYDGHQWEVDPI